MRTFQRVSGTKAAQRGGLKGDGGFERNVQLFFSPKQQATNWFSATQERDPVSGMPSQNRPPIWGFHKVLLSWHPHFWNTHLLKP